MRDFPAFPGLDKPTGYTWEGMQLRDYFAAKAIYSCFSELTRQVGEGELSGFGWGDVAESAYVVADAMMKAREAK